jgi:hypothetical protein
VLLEVLKGIRRSAQSVGHDAIQYDAVRVSNARRKKGRRGIKGKRTGSTDEVLLKV